MCGKSFQALLNFEIERAEKMDKNILAKLYNGHIHPAERGTNHIAEYDLVSYKISQEEEYLKTKLSDEDYSRFRQLEPLYSQQEGLSNFDMFCYGFRLATQLFVEGTNSLGRKGY